MKINETKEIVPLRELTKAESRKVGAREDRVTAEETESALKAIAVARQGTGLSRSARLDALAAAVEAGTYKPDPSAIAQDILEDAELIARLQVMLQRD
jgi:anti-sigma28 factor (negative regulator of flagellin synthesis)